MLYGEMQYSLTIETIYRLVVSNSGAGDVLEFSFMVLSSFHLPPLKKKSRPSLMASQVNLFNSLGDSSHLTAASHTSACTWRFQGHRLGEHACPYPLSEALLSSCGISHTQFMVMSPWLGVFFLGFWFQENNLPF